MKYKIVNLQDENVEMDLASTDDQEAALEALEILGWVLKPNGKSDAEDKRYRVKITETNVACIHVSATDKEDAKEQARDLYDTQETLIGEYISMDEGGVEFEVEEE